MEHQVITLGGGCFWCLEAIYQRVEGVLKVTSGYMGGKQEEATYEAVCSGTTEHAEVVQVEYDSRVSLEALLDIFWKMHDPTTLNRQGNDVGPQYRSVVFFRHEAQESVIVDSMKAASQLFTQPLCTQVLPAKTFYPAEAYHDNYFNTHPHVGYSLGVIAPKVEKFLRLFPKNLKKN